MNTELKDKLVEFMLDYIKELQTENEKLKKQEYNKRFTNVKHLKKEKILPPMTFPTGPVPERFKGSKKK